jgi:hypothetical protein
MCLSLGSPPNRILARLDVRTTLSKKFNDRNRRPMWNARPIVAGKHQVRCTAALLIDLESSGGKASAQYYPPVSAPFNRESSRYCAEDNYRRAQLFKSSTGASTPKTSGGSPRPAAGCVGSRDPCPSTPTQRAAALIGSIRRDCLDHVVVFGERDLRHLLNSYQRYYNEARTHLSLHKDAPIPRAVQTVGRTLAMPILGGLHHQYFRA